MAVRRRARVADARASIPSSGSIYFSTGNPGPDLHGGVRPGDNLFSVSIVAIEAKTGKYRWHFQQVHHDIWDYDSPNPVVLFDAPIDGTMRKGLVEVSKTGWAYILDRETGKPLIGIEEKPVPQEPRQATAATQPYPDRRRDRAAVDRHSARRLERDCRTAHALVNDGKIFTPFWTEPIAVKPGTMGGANWPPSSYDPETHLLYVCASDRINSFGVQEKLETPAARTRSTWAARFVQADADDRGILAALDVRTNKLAWRQQWREICYSGSVVTAGGLLFVGRNDGRLTALDKAQRHDALGVHDRRRREHDRDDVRVERRAARRRARGRRRVRRRDARRRHLDVLADGHDEVVCRPTSAAPGRWRRRLRPAGPRRRRPSAPSNVDHGKQLYAEACVACHGEGGRRRPRRRADARRGPDRSRRSCACRRPAGTRCRPSAARIARRISRTSRAYIVDVLAKK